MPILEDGPVKIHYKEAGSGFPLLVQPGGGLEATIAGLDNHSFNHFTADRGAQSKCMISRQSLAKN